MAAVRSRALLPVGSSQWIANERDSVRQFTDAEVEEFAFSVRNEMDWLNEHMADIFSRQQLDVAEVFKTPGKLRGKTPRTARKKNLLEERAPLTDIFANPKAASSPSHETQFYRQIAQVQLAEDPPRSVQDGVVNAVKDRAYRAGKENTDSGYHGMSSDDMDTDEAPTASGMDPIDIATANNTRLNASQTITGRATDERTTEGSYHSAPEELGSRNEHTGSRNGIGSSADALTGVNEKQETLHSPNRSPNRIDEQRYPSVSPIRIVSPAKGTSVEDPVESVLEDGHVSASESQHEDAGSRTTSEGSSPVRPFIRKNSLKLPSLPAREPLTTKKSIGARASRTSHLDQLRANGPSLAGYQGRQTGGKGSSGSQHAGKEPDRDGYRSDDDEHGRGQLDDALKLHSKTSTQRLNEQIYMLGQSRPPRPTKSVLYPELPQVDSEKPTAINLNHGNPLTLVPAMAKPALTDDDDDWIPMKPTVPVKSAGRPHVADVNPADAMEQDTGKVDTYESRHGVSALGLRPVVKTRSPLRQPEIPERGSSILGHHKNASTSILPSPTRLESTTDLSTKPISVSNPNLPSVFEDDNPSSMTTALTGSPTSRRFVDGPSSAKAKLTSMLKSAKGLFASSASVSAAAKMESFSPSSSRTRDHASIEDVMRGKQGSRNGLESVETQQHEAANTGFDARSSADREDKLNEKEAKERERIVKEQQRNDGRLEKAREKERQKAAVYGQEMGKVAILEKPESKAVGPHKHFDGPNKMGPGDTNRNAGIRVNAGTINAVLPDDDVEMTDASAPAPEVPLSRGQVQPPSQVQKPRELRRPTRPTKANSVKPKPTPVAIQVYTSQRELDHRKIHPSNSTLATNLQELLPAPAPKQVGPVGKASNSSLQTVASTNSIKGSTSSASTRSKAPLTAASMRKKEQDEREARRKLEHKREMERKHASQQEEQRRQEEQIREAERQRERERVDSKKITAQKQAIERRRLENAKKGEQKSSTMGAKLRSANNTVRAVEQEKMLPPPPPHRGELGAGRPPSKANTVGNLRPPVESLNRPPIQPNPARPPKRVLPSESIDDEPYYRQANGNGGPSYQQNDSKRRRTNEDLEEELRQKMPPPVRQSVIRKDVPSKPHGYAVTQPPQGASHGGSSLLKSTTTAQHHMQHNKGAHQMEMAKFATAKIPFADNPNATSHKTPVHSARSSPRYPNGEEVELPEVPTDSEDDEEESSSFAVPGWVNSPYMRTALMNQELVDPEEVFGPVGPLHMDEIFRDNARQHRLKIRSSSANWSGQDALTQEDIQSYMEERERLIANGGWTYKTS
ncbi:hypothetical protein GP486_006629 [Trichoglossum hirsutum]|uniref:Inner centromere protein ARK-binding domain-containing protein n=1 Tax=Trichoglossum hirsutum TaxID=265104 RepID=A0A9P8IE59_9PEZI|nr:hypothetical protein GP486_006629 [Trichoglossum hirsutum]